MTFHTLPGSNPQDRNLLGGKAWSIQRMQSLGMPVPPAFVLGTDQCTAFYANQRQLPAAIIESLPQAIAWLEGITAKHFGSGQGVPLLVSVRSGAPASMPGMMDTLLNLGMNDRVQAALARATGAPGFAADARERFECQYRDIVGQAAPEDPWEQLRGAIAAVFDSWNSKRAQAYRRDRGLAQDGGTAVTVQAMVFGNLDERSGTGVLFSRNPIDGSPVPYGEWLRRGQGEEVVSGRRTPEALEALARQLPEQHAQLMKLTAELERDGRDAQDIEFTVEAGTLWLLQTRSAKRSPAAAIRLAVALKEEGLIDEELALRRIDSRQVEAVLAPHVDAAALAAATVLARGKQACSGVVSGVLVCNVDEAEQRALDGESIILARPTTDPDDVHAMSVVAGVLTELGGATSHAAVVSREIGVPCVVGCGEDSLMELDQRTVTLDAVNGVVYADALPIHTADSRENTDLELLTLWARQQAGGGESSLIELLQRR